MLVLHWWPSSGDGAAVGKRLPVPHASLGTRVQNPAERFPVAAGPALQLHLGPDHVAGFAGVGFDSRSGCRKHDMTERFGLLDDVLSRKIISALPQYRFKYHTLHVAGEITGVLEIRARQVLGEVCLVGLDAFVA